MVEGEPHSASVDVVESFNVVERFRCYSSQIATACFVRPKPGSSTGVVRARPNQIGRHRLRSRRAAGSRPRVRHIQADFELVAREVTQIGRATELVLPVVADDAFIVIVIAAEEVPNGLGTPLEGQTAANWLPCGKRRAEAARNVVLDQIDVLDDAVIMP